MARYERFEDLPVWQEAERLYGAVLDLLEGSPKGLSYSFRNQIDRASLSVSNFLSAICYSVGGAALYLLFSICYLLFRKCCSGFLNSFVSRTRFSPCRSQSARCWWL